MNHAAGLASFSPPKRSAPGIRTVTTETIDIPEIWTILPTR
jgi:hypothetical protein